MIQIRSLGRQELKRVLSLLEADDVTSSDTGLLELERFKRLYLPFHHLSELLPLPMKWLPGIYVATSQGEVLGLICLSRYGHAVERWKVDQLIINPDVDSSFDVGKQLVTFAMNRYGAWGVETFLAHVDTHNQEAQALLKDCGFRHCARFHTMELSFQADSQSAPSCPIISNLREAHTSDGIKLRELYAETLPPEVRSSLRKRASDFMPSFISQCLFPQWVKGAYRRWWVVGTKHKEYLMGALFLETSDYKQFQLALHVSPGWMDGVEPLLQLALSHIAQNTNSASITTQVFEFHKDKLAVLEQAGFQRTDTTEVLVRDFWQVSSLKHAQQKNPLFMFSDKGRPSPA